MLAARFIHAIHWLFLIFVLTGWLSPWTMGLIAHAIVIPCLILHWRTNNNRCVLTELEERYRERPEEALPETPKEAAEEGQFIRSAWEKMTGRKPSDDFLAKLIYGVMAGVLGMTIIRLALRAQIF